MNEEHGHLLLGRMVAYKGASCKAQVQLAAMHLECIIYAADGPEFIQDPWHQTCANDPYTRPGRCTADTQGLAVGPTYCCNTRTDVFRWP